VLDARWKVPIVRRREKGKRKLLGLTENFSVRKMGEVGGLWCKIIVAFRSEMNDGDLKYAPCAPSVHMHWIHNACRIRVIP
jgi:hypothetical protein